MPRLFYPPLVEPGVYIKPKGTKEEPNLTFECSIQYKLPSRCCRYHIDWGAFYYKIRKQLRS